MYSSTKSSLVLGGIASTRLMTIIDEIGRINRLIELSTYSGAYPFTFRQLIRV